MSQPNASSDTVSLQLNRQASPRVYRALMILVPFLLLFGGACICPTSVVFPFATVKQTSAAEASLFLDILASGVYTPTGDGHILAEGESEPAAVDLDDLAAAGYIAVRVPHAPPDYTPSILKAGAADGAFAGYFRYYAPPTSTVESIVPMTLTRRSELEAAIDARFPITDGRSHWEVWWLPAGEKFPVPEAPFAIKGQYPPPLGLEFRVDFGATSTDGCRGCRYSYAAYDGGVLRGPFTGTLTYVSGGSGAFASFGSHCMHAPTALSSTGSLLLTSGRPFRLTYCLENYDQMAHTFQVEAVSRQAWAYTFYTQTTEAGSFRVPVGSAPFQTTVAGFQGGNPGLMAIHAVFTPTFASDAGIDELLQLHASSPISPSMAASGISTAFTLAYDPQRAAGPKVYLPVLLR